MLCDVFPRIRRSELIIQNWLLSASWKVIDIQSGIGTQICVITTFSYHARSLLVLEMATSDRSNVVSFVMQRRWEYYFVQENWWEWPQRLKMALKSRFYSALRIRCEHSCLGIVVPNWRGKQPTNREEKLTPCFEHNIKRVCVNFGEFFVR